MRSRPHRSLLPLLALLAATLLLTACADRPRPGDDPGYAAHPEALVVCGDGPTVPGIDVSSWQGAINWSAVASAGIRFAIVRIGDGGYHDADFARNWSGARAAGLIRGAYQYFEPGQDPMTQANIVVSAVGRLGPNDLPVTIDVEAPSPSVSPAEYTRRIHVWVDRVTAGTGRPPIIYTGRYYWDPYVASSDFTSLPLWHAQYTSASCPNIDDRWHHWAFWQFTSSGSVSGIGGNVDRDRWNGTYAQLQAFAHSNQKPRGYLDGVTCDNIHGWAQDQDSPDSPIDVHVYIGGPAGDASAVGFPIHANVHRDDLCTAIGSCNHGFVMTPPLSFFDGMDHPVYAYGIDSMGGPNQLLTHSPRTLHCDAAPLPTPPTGTVKRHVPNPDVLAAWHLGFIDVAPISDAMLDAIPQGPDVVDQPELVQASGDPAVYLLENQTLRHVPDPAAMDAWHFDWGGIESVDPSDLDTDVTGAPLLDRPFLAQGSGPAVYLIDAPPPLWADLIDDDAPSTVMAGHATEVTFRFTNRGSATWPAGEVMLAPTPRDAASDLCDPSWPSCTRAATLDADVAPGEEGDFTVRLAGPTTPGDVTQCFGLVMGDHWFSDPGQMGPADDAICPTIHVIAADPTGGDVGDVGGEGGGDGGVDVPSSPAPSDGRGLNAGCSCRVGAGEGGGSGATGLWLGVLGIAVVAGRRRRRRR